MEIRDVITRKTTIRVLIGKHERERTLRELGVGVEIIFKLILEKCRG
jgi:hypothetical protein